jgi:hypothetical protein
MIARKTMITRGVDSRHLTDGYKIMLFVQRTQQPLILFQASFVLITHR